MRRSVILLFLVVTGASAQFRPDAVQPAPESKRTVQRGTSMAPTLIMPLGDSITELDWQGGYRGYLYKILSDSGADFDFVGTKTTNHDDANLGFTFPIAYWDHEGYNSATISGESGSTWIWNENIEAKLTVNPPDVVLVLLGTNDLNSSCCTVADIAGDMSAFVDQIWAFDSTIVVILGSPPPADSARYSRLNTRITEYAGLLPSLVGDKRALGRAIGFADHHAVMNSTSDLVGDGIHPSPQGYRKMAQVWYDAITADLPLSPVAGDAPGVLPASYALMQNYPNPFNPSTTVTYTVPTQSRVDLRVFNVLGEAVAVLVDEIQSPGVKRVQWDARNRPGGVYFYRIIAGSFSETRTMLLIH
jgi:lysophospholipase L1-like esterase